MKWGDTIRHISLIVTLFSVSTRISPYHISVVSFFGETMLTKFFECKNTDRISVFLLFSETRNRVKRGQSEAITFSQKFIDAYFRNYLYDCKLLHIIAIMKVLPHCIWVSILLSACQRAFPRKYLRDSAPADTLAKGKWVQPVAIPRRILYLIFRWVSPMLPMTSPNAQMERKMILVDGAFQGWYFLVAKMGVYVESNVWSLILPKQSLTAVPGLRACLMLHVLTIYTARQPWKTIFRHNQPSV